MTGYLLDTNAISILAPKAGEGHVRQGHVVEFRKWVRRHDAELFLSVITLMEIQAGISRLERKGAARQAADLSRWLGAILDFYGSRTLSLTPLVALEAGRLLDRAIGIGTDPGFEDAAIAATAAVHDLIVVTANSRHFAQFGVPFVAPQTLNGA